MPRACGNQLCPANTASWKHKNLTSWHTIVSMSIADSASHRASTWDIPYQFRASTHSPHQQLSRPLRTIMASASLRRPAHRAFLQRPQGPQMQADCMAGRLIRKRTQPADAEWPWKQGHSGEKGRPVYHRLFIYTHGIGLQGKHELRRMPVSDRSAADQACQEDDQ